MGKSVLLLMDNLGGDGWPTRLMRLRAGAVVWQQDYPSARAEDAVTQRALDILPYEGGALIALRFGHPLAGECLLRQVDAQGGVVAEWRAAFPELYGVQKAALVPCGEEVYLAAYGEPAEAAALETADWFDGSDPTWATLPTCSSCAKWNCPRGRRADTAPKTKAAGPCRSLLSAPAYVPCASLRKSRGVMPVCFLNR